MYKKDLVSIIMSTYNEKYEDLNIAINSILNQTYNNIEFIIVIDNPNNLKIKKQLINHMKKDNRIILIQNNQNIGLVKSLNRALEVAKGRYIARMDADDISEPTRIEKQVKYLQNNENIYLVGTNIEMIDEENNIIPKNNIFIKGNKNIAKAMRFGNCLAHPTWMFRRELLSKVNSYRDIPFAEDYDFLIRTILNGFEIDNIDEKLLKYRIRKNGISKSNEYNQIVISRMIRKYYNKRNLQEYENLPYNINKKNMIIPKLLRDNEIGVKEKSISRFVKYIINKLQDANIRNHLISRFVLKSNLYKIVG